MSIVVDTNILLSCLLTDGLRRKIFFEHPDFFFAPPFIIEEIEKYKIYVLEKSGIPEHDFDELYDQLFSKITVVNQELLDPYVPTAFAMVPFDTKDTAFLACALATKSILWSDDAALKKQKAIVVLDTSEMKAQFNRGTNRSQSCARTRGGAVRT